MRHRLKAPPKVALPPVERNKCAAFFHLLMTIERRHATAQLKSKKIQPSLKVSADKPNPRKVAEIGSLNRGPYFFLDKIMYAINRINLILKSAYYDDRHYSFNSHPGSF